MRADGGKCEAHIANVPENVSCVRFVEPTYVRASACLCVRNGKALGVTFGVVRLFA